MIRDAECVSVCFLAICTPSLVRFLLRSFASFLTRLFVFLLLNFESSLYILNNSTLSDVSFANIFSQFVVYHLILLTVSFTEKFLILMKLR